MTSLGGTGETCKGREGAGGDVDYKALTAGPCIAPIGVWAAPHKASWGVALSPLSEPLYTSLNSVPVVSSAALLRWVLPAGGD